MALLLKCTQCSKIWTNIDQNRAWPDWE